MGLIVKKSAHISPCGKYRYSLSRCWQDSGPFLTFLMLNPSIADAEHDDPTCRKVAKFAYREGYAGVHIINIYAFRTSYPAELFLAEDPVGPENNLAIFGFAQQAAQQKLPLVCAWGARRDVQVRARYCYDLMQKAGAERLVCLERTKSGYPRHPLFCRNTTKLREYTCE